MTSQGKQVAKFANTINRSLVYFQGTQLPVAKRHNSTLFEGYDQSDG